MDSVEEEEEDKVHLTGTHLADGQNIDTNVVMIWVLVGSAGALTPRAGGQSHLAAAFAPHVAGQNVQGLAPGELLFADAIKKATGTGSGVDIALKRRD